MQFRIFWRAAATSGVVVLLALLPVVPLAPPATADPGTGSIEFALTNWADGTAASGGCMQVFDSAQTKVREDCAGAAGTYTVTALGDGSYRVKLAGFAGAVATQWYGQAPDFSTAKVVTVESGSAYVDNATLLQTYSIVGRVVDSAGNPFPGGVVEISKYGSRDAPLYTTTVADDGRWATPSMLSCGSRCDVQIKSFPNQPNLWLQASPGWYAPVTAFGYTLPLAGDPGHFVGTIATPGNFTGDSACVLLYTTGGAGPEKLDDRVCGTVGSPFVFDHVDHNTSYAMCVVDTVDPTATCLEGPSAWDFFGGASGGPVGIKLTAVAGTTVTVPLAFGGTLTATPTVQGGGPLSGGCMDVFLASSPTLMASDCSPAGGTFSATFDQDSEWLDGYTGQFPLRFPYGLRVHFRDFKGGADAWKVVPNSGGEVSTVVVGGGATVDVSTALEPWGSVAGTIALPSGTTATAGCVRAIDDSGAYADGPNFEPVCADPATGIYTLPLPPGDYSLEFYTNTTDTAAEWYDSVPTQASATRVKVASGAQTVINSALATAGSISGNVVLAGGGGATSGCVDVYDTNQDFVSERCVNVAGHFVIDSLPAGSYLLYFTGYGAWAGHWYSNTQYVENATPVEVAAGQNVTLPAVTLGREGTISGTVTKPGGGAALNGCVTLYQKYDAPGGSYTFSSIAHDCVDGAGHYSLTAPPGNYRVLFSGFSGDTTVGLADRWYSGAASMEASTVVTLAAGATLTRNQALSPGGRLILTPWTTAGGYNYRAYNGCAQIYEWYTDHLATVQCANSSGVVNASLPAGEYYAYFEGFDSAVDLTTTSLPDAWLDQLYTRAGATRFVVSSGAVENRTVALPTPATIRGTVTVPEGALLDGQVLAFTTDGDYVGGSAVKPDGTYSIDGVFAGVWIKLKFTGFTGAADEWLDDGNSFGNAFGMLPSEYSLVTPARTVALAPEGVLTGIMNVPSNFTGATACVTAYFDDGYYAGEACGAVGQPFAIHSLPASTLRLEFSDATRTRFYRSDVWETAVTVAVSSGTTTNVPIIWNLPGVTGVSPGFGPTMGGTSVAVTGSGLLNAEGVTFGGVAGTGMVVVDDSHLTVTTPAGASLQAPIVVTTPVGVSPVVPTVFFAFTDSSVVAGIPAGVADVSNFKPGVVKCFQVTGRAGVPQGAVGVTLNVTASLPNGAGHVRVYPDSDNNGATPPPAVSTVNFEAGRDVANSTTIALPDSGRVCAYSVGGTMSRLILDVESYTLPNSGIVLTTPAKLIDTRSQSWYHVGPVNGPVQPLTDYEVQVTGNAGVPVGATAVMVNITVVDTNSPGHLRMWAADQDMPNTSVVNYAPETKANSQIVALSADGKLKFRSFTWVPTSVSPVQVLIDVTGYIEEDSDFVATTPTTIVETRPAYTPAGLPAGPLTQKTVYPLTLDTTVVPAGATAVVLNVTAVQPTNFGHIRVYPDTNGLGTTTPPVMSNINFIPGRDIPNMVIVQLPQGRTIDFYTAYAGTGRTDLKVDLIGYIKAP